ncbi:LysR family transcriptional regulator [Aquibacillus albus]|uniref:DNA-binding transcriptional LysR family regulator n=1 Tax=Aquibacillus albus TaxID=1168171 RepID=A0ABS2MX09_9BACI|nr:DNA-binding transcriptional LysR family regulator [Aquibacillus albus]
MDHSLMTFITVAEKKNFTRAAETLHLTQAAVTLAIQKLEKQYQVKLFDRTNKFVHLTRAGEILYHHGKEILFQYERVERLIDDLSNSASGEIRIGSSYTFGEYILPKLIAQFGQYYPKITPDISIRNTSRVISQLLRGQLDLAIIEGEVEHADVMIKPFAKDEMVVIVSAYHPLSTKNEVTLDDLANETWIIREGGSGTRQRIDQFFKEEGFSPIKTRDFGSSQIIKESVEAGLGVSIVSTVIIQKEIELGTIKALRIKDNPIVRSFSYVMQQTSFHPKSTKLFVEFLDTYYE